MSGLIPQNFINDLIESADIVEIIGSRLELKKAGRNFQGLCPFHNEKTPSFSVSSEKQFFHCFGCKESGTVLTFLMKYENLDFVVIYKPVYEQFVEFLKPMDFSIAFKRMP